MRCCVYKERAILSERVKIAIGSNPNIIEVIDIACDECPMGGYEVTNACADASPTAVRMSAASAHSLLTASTLRISTRRNARSARVLQSLPLHRDYKPQAPLRDGVQDKGYHMNENKAAAINYDKCISCGACVYQCPFGAITDSRICSTLLIL